MNLDDKSIKQLRRLILFTIVILIALWNYAIIFEWIGVAFGIVFPFLLGGGIAFILNVPMTFLEKKIFRNRWMKEKKAAKRLARPVSLVLTIAIVVGVIVLVMFVVIPELTKTILSLGHTIRVYVPQVQEFWDDFFVDNKEYNIPVRIPQSFTTKEKFARNPKYYGYCSCKSRSRILVHPNGMLRVCSLMIGTPYGIARYYDDKIVWDDSPTNELRAHKFDEDTPCTNQFKHNKFGKYIPVCVSFKPKQEEMIWKELGWENKTTGDKIRTVIGCDDKEENEITSILNKIEDVEIVAVAKNANDTCKKIIELKPEMVFTKFNFENDNMNGLDIIKKSKEVLNDEVPVFNIIAHDISKDDFLEARNEIGDKMNTIIREQTENRYNGIIEDYKDYLNQNTNF